ncbi:HDIG domain-containing protein [Maridesulfovibrio ferrireducens]|uniref:HDIG domain-containing protein n=1 Tax=Maridesulfovibrio ferrireducens TaxID=246191 RepID=A0A1G9I2P1_9BACT|nr:HDOD domain-containing protein [Maridesulfovibrio ferrireducens]SDL19510.1 HDIG domain-containing protein [Maridesulfovibrio ferrireducens]
MRSVGIDDLEPGMILANDLLHSGRMLLPAGSVVTSSNITFFQRQGIENITVLSSPPVEPDEETLDRSFRYVRDYFMFVNHNHPAIIKMFDISVYRTATKLMEGWTLPSSDEQTVTELDDMRDLFFRDEGKVEDVVDAEIKIASFPDIFFKVKKVVDDPTASAQEIAAVVGLDVAISTQLLKLVNSPLYGFPSEISSLVRAVALVGSRELCTLALGLSTISYFKDIPPELIDMRSFWMHSLSCGIFSKILAEKVKGVVPEVMFTAGLLHDVGRLIVFKKMPCSSIQAMLYARENFIPLVEAEDMTLGFNHTDVAKDMLGKWKFPNELTDAISNHHSPHNADSKVQATILQVADNLANAIGISDGGMYVIPGIEEGAWELLGIDADSLTLIVEDYDRQIEELFQAFFT